MFVGGDPSRLASAGTLLTWLSEDLASDAVTGKGHGQDAAGAAAGEVGVLAEIAVASASAALVAGSVLVAALSSGANVSGDHLIDATGG